MERTQLFEGDTVRVVALEFGLLSETLDQFLGQVTARNAKILGGVDDISIVGEEDFGLAIVVLR
jgi:hypothetical protein